MSFPWGEDWVFCEAVLVPLWDGHLTWSDFATPVNGYVKMSTWALRMPLAWLTHWHQAWEAGLNIALGVGTLIAVLLMFRRAARAADRPFPHALVPLISLVILGLDKSCIWFWGDGLTYVLATWAVVAGIAVLAPSNLSIPRVLLAGILGAIAVFSFASGFIYLIAGFILLAGVPDRARRLRFIAAWMAFSLGIGVLYWLNTKGQVVDSPPDAQWMARATLTIRFLPIFLGAGLLKFHLSAAGMLGVAGLAAGAVMFWKTVLRDRAAREQCVPFLCLMLFALLCGITACASRYKPATSLHVQSYGGLLEGAALRYPFFSQFYWVGLLGLLWLQLPARDSIVGIAKRSGRWWFVAVCCLMLAGASILSSRTGYYEAQERYQFYGARVRRIVVEDLPAIPTRLQWPYGSDRPEAVRSLRAHELSFFRPEARSYWTGDSAVKDLDL